MQTIKLYQHLMSHEASVLYNELHVTKIKTLSCAASELETFLAPAADDVIADGRGHRQLSWRGQGTTDITWVTCNENLSYNNSAPLLPLDLVI